ncbi:MAG TPA: hypothetical protein DDW52_19300 [Planctomycetaceae bacterium]|nr:hypothetical protein [Planctomycetaceae bacterium]
MAKCDEGYLCEVCGAEVKRLDESALYLQYVIGWIDPETLHTRKECHLRCNPALAQFIESPDFAPVVVEGPADCRLLDAAFVAERKMLITRGFERLQELQRHRSSLSVLEYPLPDVMQRWK